MRREPSRGCVGARSQPIRPDSLAGRTAAPAAAAPASPVQWGGAGSGAGPDTRRPSMLDAVLLTSTLAFFLLGLAYVRGCDHL